MSNRFASVLQGLAGNGGLLAGGARGIEKESLRISTDGLIAQTPHPAALGSALTHKFITTDYSEALLEFVTPPEPSAWAAMQYMCDIHQYAYSALDDELLWPFSMPCRLRSEADIPLARYGESNIGRMKTIYRNGLGLRYGRYMQVISGIHFNYSLPDAFWPAWGELQGGAADEVELKSSSYMGLVRNVRRLDWLLLYLFGASPAICASFLDGADTTALDQMDDKTFYGKWATSLRMSDLGYQNSTQARLQVSANSLDEYVHDLCAAIATPNADYEQLGIKNGDEYLQLNANMLQIENEYYSTIRPKRVAHSGERPTSALRRGGVEYIELRALDISPFDPAGMGQPQQKFLEVFLLYCLLQESPPISPQEAEEARFNHLETARRGRDPELKLRRDGTDVPLRDWGQAVCEDMLAVAELLDAAGQEGYQETVRRQLESVADPEKTPSARLLGELRDGGQSFAEYGLAVATDYKAYFAGLDDEFNAHRPAFADESTASVKRQQQIEAADTLSLDEYLQRYYA